MYFKTRWYHYHKWHIRDVVSSWKVVYIIPHWEGGGGGGFSGFQVIGMIEWEQTSQPIKIPRASNKTPPKSLGQNLTLQKSHAEFPSHKHVKKALNYITRIFETSVLNTQKIPTSKKTFPTQNNL